jgi:hypothetical protein
MQGSKEFDPLAFLSQEDAGKTIERYRKNQKIFSLGEVADAGLDAVLRDKPQIRKDE